MGRLEGKVALITGAGQGIGRSCMQVFAREGAQVCGVSRTQRNLEETLATLAPNRGKASVFAADLATPEGAEAATAHCLEAHGRVDILVNAAGVGYSWRHQSPGSMDPVHSTPVDKWREVMAINLDSVFYMSRLVLQHMRVRKMGSIVNIASIFGLGGAPDAHTYTATKGAIINLTRSMAVAYVDDHIRCNVVAPGFVQTQMVEEVLPMLFSAENPKLISPMGRPATVEEVALATLFLASDEASYCTGVVLPVDGGETARA